MFGKYWRKSKFQVGKYKTIFTHFLIDKSMKIMYIEFIFNE